MSRKFFVKSYNRYGAPKAKAHKATTQLSKRGLNDDDEEIEDFPSIIHNKSKKAHTSERKLVQGVDSDINKALRKRGSDSEQPPSETTSQPAPTSSEDTPSTTPCETSAITTPCKTPTATPFETATDSSVTPTPSSTGTLTEPAQLQSGAVSNRIGFWIGVVVGLLVLT